jgi:hypothetical protein
MFDVTSRLTPERGIADPTLAEGAAGSSCLLGQPRGNGNGLEERVEPSGERVHRPLLTEGNEPLGNGPGTVAEDLAGPLHLGVIEGGIRRRGTALILPAMTVVAQGSRRKIMACQNLRFRR